MLEGEEYQTYKRQHLFLNPNDEELPYRRRQNEDKLSTVWGQRKLLLSLIQFLTLFWDPKKVSKPIVVYAGSAPGNNIAIVSKFFPEVEFHLYDPRDFKIEKSKRIHIYQEYFTDKTADKWKDRDNIYFVSDIRTADHTKIKDLDKNEKQILGDMQMQMRWYNIIRPTHGHLKFRLPYTGGERPPEVEYLDGYVFKQPFSPQTSTETRLVPTNNTRMWSCQKYQSQMFHHNVIIREKLRYLNPFTNSPDTVDFPELLNDWDSITETKIWMDYLVKRTGKCDPTSVKSLSRLITKRLTEKSKYKDTLNILRSNPQAIKLRNIKQSRDNLGESAFNKPPTRHIQGAPRSDTSQAKTHEVKSHDVSGRGRKPKDTYCKHDLATQIGL